MHTRHFSWPGGLLLASLLLTGCACDTAVKRLSLEEQSQFYTYHQVMTGSQRRAYLAKASAAERTAYLNEVGLAQKFQRLDPVDRDTVLSGLPRQGMSMDALRFLWGEPYRTDGDARRYGHWHYLGSSFGMGVRGNHQGNVGNQVDVYLVDGQVVSWVDVAPSSHDSSGESGRR